VALPVLPERTRVRYLDAKRREGVAWPRLHRHPWESPREAIAELDADLASGAPITSPVRLVLPLIREAIAIQWRNSRACVLVSRASWAIRFGSEDDCRRLRGEIERAGRRAAMAAR
jgi:hypothetical protein